MPTREERIWAHQNRIEAARAKASAAMSAVFASVPGDPVFSVARANAPAPVVEAYAKACAAQDAAESKAISQGLAYRFASGGLGWRWRS